MTTRTAVSKGKRFDVFRRDGFTCRYCGAKPPEVVLELDHVMPVAAGGTNDADNLIAACEACNRGKAAKLLGDAPAPVDGDLRYLETQQEIAELKRWQGALYDLETARDEIVDDLKWVWSRESGLPGSPPDKLLRQLLTKYPVEIVDEALRDVSVKLASGYIKGQYAPYLWTVCKNRAESCG